MNFTIHKASSQINVDILSFTKDPCTEAPCKTEGSEKYTHFVITLAVTNLGFTAGANIQVDAKATQGLEINDVLDESSTPVTIDNPITTLSIGDLQPIQTKLYYVYAQIATSTYSSLP